MAILDAGLVPSQLASEPIGFLDAPPYEKEEFHQYKHLYNLNTRRAIEKLEDAW